MPKICKKQLLALTMLNATLFSLNFSWPVQTKIVHASQIQVNDKQKVITLNYLVAYKNKYKPVYQVNIDVKPNEIINYQKYLPKGISLVQQDLPKTGKDAKNNTINIKTEKPSFAANNINRQLKLEYVNVLTNKVVNTQIIHGLQGDTQPIQYNLPKNYGFTVNTDLNAFWYLYNDQYKFIDNNQTIKINVAPLSSAKDTKLMIYYRDPNSKQIIASERVNKLQPINQISFLYPLQDLIMPGAKDTLANLNYYDDIFKDFKQDELVLDVINTNALIKQDNTSVQDVNKIAKPNSSKTNKQVIKYKKKGKPYKPHIVYNKNGFRDANAISKVITSKKPAQPDSILDTPVQIKKKKMPKNVQRLKRQNTILPNTGADSKKSLTILGIIMVCLFVLGRELLKIRNIKKH